MLSTLLNLIVFLISLGVLILVHELGHFLFARLFGVKVKRFSIGFGKVLLRLGVDKKGTEYVVSAIPLGGFVEMEGESYADSKGLPGEFVSKPVWQRALIVSAGPLVNYLTGFLLLFWVYLSGAPELLPIIGKVLDGSSAQKAGIMAGDRILAIDGHRIDLWDELSGYIRGRAGKQVSLLILRDNKEVTIRLVPQEGKIRNIFGQDEKVGLIGVMPDMSAYNTVRFPFLKAAEKAVMRVRQTTVMVLRSIYLLISGNKQIREAVAGPIGIYEVTSKARVLGINVLLMVLATLSISLAVFNLLPIPVLDGGHLVFFALEALLGRPVPDRFYDYLSKAGLSLLILLMAFVFYNDIRKLRHRNSSAIGLITTMNGINSINDVFINEGFEENIP